MAYHDWTEREKNRFVAGLLIAVALTTVVVWVAVTGRNTGDQMLLEDGTRVIKLCDWEENGNPHCNDWYRVEGPVSLSAIVIEMEKP